MGLQGKAGRACALRPKPYALEAFDISGQIAYLDAALRSLVVDEAIAS